MWLDKGVEAFEESINSFVVCDVCVHNSGVPKKRSNKFGEYFW